MVPPKIAWGKSNIIKNRNQKRETLFAVAQKIVTIKLMCEWENSFCESTLGVSGFEY